MSDRELPLENKVRRHPLGQRYIAAVAALELPGARNFDNPDLKWRRMFSELFGTFLLVLVGAGGSVVSAVSNGSISRTAAVTAPGLMVMVVILFMGAISGEYLNPAVSIAFAARGDFPWRRVPGYIVAQPVGSALACLLLWAMIGKVGILGATEPGPGINDMQAMLMELVLTMGLVSTILGTASGFWGAEPGADICPRSCRLYYPRRTLVQPNQWGVDEPGTIFWTRSRAPRLLTLLGIPRGPDRWRPYRRWIRLYSPGTRRRRVGHPSRTGDTGGEKISLCRSADRGQGELIREGTYQMGKCSWLF